MEAFGSTKFPDPLLATAAGINAVKGRIMGLNSPFTIAKIEELAAAEVKADSDEAVNNHTTAIRSTFGLLEYFRDHRLNDVVIQALSEFQSKVGLMKMPAISAEKTTITD
ncbi:uncharacterized protein BO88DRAFT_457022 [Aspergillus vadensis CBS 113365]|uniref:Uncharacterized protein n=1 Tax=Aspergillus vadensis (strain CBS 113365 / IMI 142717 / IBT 24658) TaxID=1448311 RepID=A0A319B0Z6_ASPVC|nr:hypothetical protein BO88DRAFT_457022 [Aspergillus vadensis CBS 113365]PYH65795.1 hypothetical protein BO88DRAFT_457022 [Aspergillus vadensis CBS 113365]